MQFRWLPSGTCSGSLGPAEIALAVALGLMVSIAATAPAVAVKAIGVGLNPCGTWTADRTDRGVVTLPVEQWVVGYLSGVALWAPNLDPMKGIDAQAVWAWMDYYCRAHPQVTIRDAAEAFIQEHPGH
jgi:hypothetical protein